MSFKYLFPLFAVLSGWMPLGAAGADWLPTQTLRVEYAFAGNAAAQDIALTELVRLDGWAGRTSHLDSLPLRGNGRIVMCDAADGTVLYATSFSSLFQEWLGTEEAVSVRRSFENVFLLPMPQDSARVTVELYDFKGNTIAALSHTVNPHDILIRSLGRSHPEADAPYRYIRKSPVPEKAIDIAVVAEGYTTAEMADFYEHARVADEALFAHEPFKSYADRFNVVAVGAPSEDSGVSIPGRGVWKNTVLGSHFDTFYSGRYLTTSRLRRLHDVLAGIPYEHIIVLANTDNYGGGGIYNSYVLTTARHAAFRPVIVHEFGHSFAGLADEYFYDDQYVEYYYPEVEPWEQNITTLKDFSAKWEDLLPAGTAVPAPAGTAGEGIGVYEGGGYQSKGVYRAFDNCRMRTNEAADFCAVCRRALERLIKFYTE